MFFFCPFRAVFILNEIKSLLKSFKSPKRTRTNNEPLSNVLQVFVLASSDAAEFLAIIVNPTKKK